jgi:hypothetical protein
VFVSTHLITEFEGLIDRFTIVETAAPRLSLDADEARAKFRKTARRFAGRTAHPENPGHPPPDPQRPRTQLVTNGATEQVLAELRACQPEDIRSEALSLEEIFVVANQ